MCGIWMKTRFDRPISPEEVLRPASLLEHRGPDGWGYFANPRVLLLQTRLSIVDLEGGSQPLLSFDGRYIGVVNGELYDYESHRQDLQADGVSFKTRSDSEVLLNLYAKRGVAGLHNLSGEFAFIFYDQRGEQIIFGRDAMGVKPLFLKLEKNSLSLASEMKALVSGEVIFNDDYLRTYLAHALTPPETSLKGIDHVWPGQLHVFDLKSKQLRSESFQALPLFGERKLRGSDAVGAVDFELRAAVKRRLRADVEVGSYLSGGIDSALVAAIAADQGARLRTFTVGFEDSEYDESKLAAKIAQDLGLAHTTVELNAKNFMASFKKSIVAFENPVSNPHGAAKNLLSAKAASELKVVLSGEGADEWFGGYAYLRIQKIKNFSNRHPHLGQKALKNFLTRESEMNLNHLDGHATEYGLLAQEYFKGLIPSFVGRIAPGTTEEKVRSIFEKLSSLFFAEMGSVNLNDWDLNTWIAVRSDLLHYILANVGDRQEMSNSLEGRTPFLDIRVAQVAGQIRENDLMKGLREKDVLRQVAKKYLKPEHFNRPKRPFFAPSKYLFQRENRAEVDFYINAAEKAVPNLEWSMIRRLIRRDDPPRSLKDQDELLFFTLFSFSLGVLAKELVATNKEISREELSKHRRVF